MSLQLQTTASLWSTQTGLTATLHPLQQDAGNAAESGSPESAAFSIAMAQSQAVQQQLQQAGATDSSDNAVREANQAQGGSAGQTGSSRSADNQSEQAQKFLDGLMEQLLANRLGVNKQEMDRLKQKIAELELKRKALADQLSKGGNDPSLSHAITQIDQQIRGLDKQLQQLIRENELAKNNPDDDNRREWSAQSLGSVASSG
jgi:hypothetical protein